MEDIAFDCTISFHRYDDRRSCISIETFKTNSLNMADKVFRSGQIVKDGVTYFFDMFSKIVSNGHRLGFHEVLSPNNKQSVDFSSFDLTPVSKK